jgi:hypothetical protein
VQKRRTNAAQIPMSRKDSFEFRLCQALQKVRIGEDMEKDCRMICSQNLLRIMMVCTGVCAGGGAGEALSRRANATSKAQPMDAQLCETDSLLRPSRSGNVLQMKTKVLTISNSLIFFFILFSFEGLLPNALSISRQGRDTGPLIIC